MLGETSFTYSNIDGLEIQQIEEPITLTCDSITQYLTKQISDRWFYWNSCRDINSSKTTDIPSSISFYVVSLDEATYDYVKHYIDTTNSLYGTYHIKSGDWIASDNTQDALAQLNNQLKEKNTTWPEISIVDNLFQQIIR